MSLWADALCELDEKHVQEYVQKSSKTSKTKKVHPWVKWIVAAACLLIIALGGGKLLPVFQHSPVSTDPVVTTLNNEALFEKAYKTVITEGEYSGYRLIRVCDEGYVGEKIRSITVEAGWKNSAGEYVSEKEMLRAEVFYFKGIGEGTAVCLKFLDEGEALTTNHFYVYVSPSADESTLAELGTMLGWPTSADPGPEENGTVSGETKNETVQE